MTNIEIYDGGYSAEQRELDQEAAKAETKTKAAKAATRASGLAKLKALGLTDDEIAALMGGN